METEEKKLKPKMYLKSEVARIYNVSMNKLRSMIGECSEEFPEVFPNGKKDHKHLLSPKQVQIIFDRFGEPTES